MDKYKEIYGKKNVFLLLFYIMWMIYTKFYRKLVLDVVRYFRSR